MVCIPRSAKWKSLSKEEIEQIVLASTSYREVAEKFGYSPNGGGTICTVKNIIEEMQIDISHFKGQGWNKDNCDLGRFKKGHVVKSSELLRALILLRGRCCECCGLSQWEGNPIPLEVHHKDEDSLNNELENVQLLCRNCHGLTDNFKGRTNSKTTCVSDEEFVNALKISPNVRQALQKLNLTPKGGNYKRAYELVNKYNIQFINT